MDKVYIIAEAGVNHNGDEALAAQLVDVASASGADAIKFQTFRASKLVQEGALTAAYQHANTGETNQFAMLRQLELSYDSHIRLAQQCRRVGIEFLSTPFDYESAAELVGMGLKRLKIGSGELTNLPFLGDVAGMGLPMILSTGMATLEEVNEAIEAIRNAYHGAGGRAALGAYLTLLHCTSNYPTAPDSVNLRAMATLHARFGVPVGYSDHTEGILAATAAAAMGAKVIEKHFTVDRSLPGPDHKASLEPGELADMVRQIRLVERMLGSGEKTPVESELAVRAVVRRSIVTRREVAAGVLINAQDIELLRPGTGIAPRDIPRVVGRRTKVNIPSGQILTWEMLEA